MKQPGLIRRVQLFFKDLQIVNRSKATELLESFLPFHIGKRPKSLAFLRQVRAGI